MGFFRSRHRHLTAETLNEYLDDRLPAAARDRVQRALAGCPDCRMELDGLRQAQLLLGQLPELTPRRSFLISPADGRVTAPAAAPRFRVPQWAYAGTASVAALVLTVMVVVDATGLVPPRIEIQQQDSALPAASQVQAESLAATVTPALAEMAGAPVDDPSPAASPVTLKSAAEPAAAMDSEAPTPEARESAQESPEESGVDSTPGSSPVALKSAVESAGAIDSDASTPEPQESMVDPSPFPVLAEVGAQEVSSAPTPTAAPTAAEMAARASRSRQAAAAEAASKTVPTAAAEKSRTQAIEDTVTAADLDTPTDEPQATAEPPAMEVPLPTEAPSLAAPEPEETPTDSIAIASSEELPDESTKEVPPPVVERRPKGTPWLWRGLEGAAAALTLALAALWVWKRREDRR